jgi:hypothetical protein
MFYQEISSGARSALPMGVAPEAIVEKDFFEYRLKNIVWFIILQLEIPCRQILVHHSNKELHSVSLKVVAPKAIIQSPSHTILSINFALAGTILLLSYTIFFMTSMKTSLCMSANRFMGSTVISTIFDR